MDWTLPWYSSGESGFSYDLQATSEEKEDIPGVSVFVRGLDGGVFHTYSTFGDAVGNLLTTYAVLDFTPLGRQEMRGPGEGKFHDEY